MSEERAKYRVKKSKVTEMTSDIRAESGVTMMDSCNPKYSFRRGVAFTTYGIVAIYDQSGEDAHTRLDFIFEGRCYTRTIARTFTNRGLITVAGRFAWQTELQVLQRRRDAK